LNQLVILFVNNLLPIFLVAGVGYLAAKYLQVTPHSISQISFYLFSPCLIFNLLTTSQLSSEDITSMAGFTIVSILALGALTGLIGWLLRLERHLLAAILITIMFGNAGNYGLSLTQFAFGEEALAYASLYFVTTAIMMYTLGVVIASLGKSSLREALLGLFKVPAVYAVIIALFFNHFDWRLPLFVDRSVTMLADAAIPVLMVLMGVQLYSSRISNHRSALVFANSMRLVVSPLIALGVSLLFHLQGPAFQAGLIESAVPSAIFTTVLATQYDIEPAFVTTVVFTSTLISPLTVTPLLAYLGA
jgi:hypothetical protein